CLIVPSHAQSTHLPYTTLFRSNTIKTLRWVQNAEYVPFAKVEAVPSLQSAETSPQKIEPGESLGKRERVKCGFKNHPHNDIGLEDRKSTRLNSSHVKITYADFC